MRGYLGTIIGLRNCSSIGRVKRKSPGEITSSGGLQWLLALGQVGILRNTTGIDDRQGPQYSLGLSLDLRPSTRWDSLIFLL